MPPDNPNMLLDSSLGNQSASLSLAAVINTVHLGRSASHANVSPIELLIQPSMLKKVFASKKTSEQGSKGDEEDAGAGVRRRACWGPCGRVEWSGVGGIEDNLHH